MDDDQLVDLKQFIETRLSQTEERIKDELRAEVEKLRAEMHEQFDGVGEAIEHANQHADEKYEELGNRIVQLEHQTAA